MVERPGIRLEKTSARSSRAPLSGGDSEAWLVEFGCESSSMRREIVDFVWSGKRPARVLGSSSRNKHRRARWPAATMGGGGSGTRA